MILKPVFVHEETPLCEELRGEFRLTDARTAMAEWRSRLAGQVQAIYIDPPFASGQLYRMRVAVTADEWRKGTGSLTLDAYRDGSDISEAALFLEDMIEGAKELLTDTGLLFVHVDWRLSGRARRILDDCFGEDHIVNEIIWSYQTGGRAKRYFSRKHDTIFLYRKGEEYSFHIDAVPVAREGARRNHMRRQVDADGRAFRTIRSGDKMYTYYDDEPVFPGDVWTDINMQQKDPQRTGYETQKPLKLLERIILCATEPGDWVADPCAGSGTTMEAAWRAERRFLGCDRSEASLLSVRRRMAGAPMRVCAPGADDAPEIEARLFGGGIGDWEMRLTALNGEKQGIDGFDRLDGWALGYLRDGTFSLCAQEQRTRLQPNLTKKLRAPVYAGDLAVRVSDVFGGTYFYIADKTSVEYEK